MNIPTGGAYAAVTRNGFGKGAAYYVGCYTSKAFLKEIYRQAAGDAGIPVPALQWPVTVRSGRTPDGRTLHFFLHYSEETRQISCPYPRVRDVLTGEELRGRRCDPAA